MDFNAAADLIIKDLDDARKIIDDFKNYPGIPVLEIELAKSKCKSASELIALLKSLQKPVSHSQPPEIKKVIRESTSKIAAESTIIADTFDHLPDSLNEKLGSLRGDDDVSDIMKTKPLTNLSNAIGVNDKFLFIRELFNGNPESYNQAINRLDEAANLADAKTIIMSYTDGNTETEAVKQLLDLVKRKFPGDE
jgi:hypothetical protein